MHVSSSSSSWVSRMCVVRGWRTRGSKAGPGDRPANATTVACLCAVIVGRHTAWKGETRRVFRRPAGCLGRLAAPSRETRTSEDTCQSEALSFSFQWIHRGGAVTRLGSTRVFIFTRGFTRLPCSMSWSSSSCSSPTACLIHRAFGFTVLSMSRYRIPGVLEIILVTFADGNNSSSLSTWWVTTNELK